jgi:hypothetical protein
MQDVYAVSGQFIPFGPGIFVNLCVRKNVVGKRCGPLPREAPWRSGGSHFRNTVATAGAFCPTMAADFSRTRL